MPQARQRGDHLGITSVCSAHPVVIEAALRLGQARDRTVLIEATCNQVNQDGGYTGMAPRDFRAFVEAIAERVGFDPARIVLGGDHLGPNPWKKLDPEAAMQKADALIAAYAEAGFSKLHLDTSMGCAGEPVALDDAETAKRAARLAEIAEAHKTGRDPVYVIGTEVPVPGGATHGLDIVEPTEPDAVTRTHEVHRAAFAERGLEAAFDRVIALVVQPGVEFGHTDVIHFDAEKAQALSATLTAYPGVVFEAHSTDYQRPEALRALVANGYAILKVGPWLTFALREALYALDALADVMEGHAPRGGLMARMEEVMRAEPANWKGYYHGSDHDTWLQRHFSFSDRIRYYWPAPDAATAVDALMDRLGDRVIPPPVRQQFFPSLGLDERPMTGRDLLLRAVTDVLKIYDDAI
ncbi:tagatose-bisphosphate aldolase [Marinibacterium profundimaris]|uniref:Tagatose-bisphosphate aldolase n=1 Tax=Marinibacterium profundimaris TaxID=1679460 RepID=A0A225NH95_9RHOB|nr:tagatose-bisphosphate aldolase [Marinibacterium profundimaris]